MEVLAGAQMFTKMNLKSGYYQIRIRERDEWEISFKTWKVYFEWLLMPFGLSNAPSTFIRFMTEALKQLLSISLMVYFDEILVFYKIREDHTRVVRKVLSVC